MTPENYMITARYFVAEANRAHVAALERKRATDHVFAAKAKKVDMLVQSYLRARNI